MYVLFERRLNSLDNGGFTVSCTVVLIQQFRYWRESNVDFKIPIIGHISLVF